MRIRFIFAAAWLLSLAACSSVHTPAVNPAATAVAPAQLPVGMPQLASPTTIPPTAPAASIVTPEQQLPLTGEATAPEAEPRPVMSANRAVLALLDHAELDSKAGKRDAAGASLERALRIEPRNPWLWLQLAQVRLAQGQYAQAITLARKANSFAARNYRLQADSWQVIAQSRVALGDTAGAEQAYKLAADLALQARAEQH